MIIPTSFRLPEDVYKWLKQRAKRNRRSISAEAVTVFEEVIKGEEKLEKAA